MERDGDQVAAPGADPSRRGRHHPARPRDIEPGRREHVLRHRQQGSTRERVTNRFGYAIEFDADGRFGDYAIDFDAAAEHLYQLNAAAKARGVSLALVILDPPYLPKLFGVARGPFLRQNLEFMKGAAWVRHDEHYHVDFAVPCRPNDG